MSEVEREHMVKVREWADGEDTGEWPAPPEYTEYRVESGMRADVLTRLGRSADDPCEVRLIQGVIEGGYSEYTVEHDYEIEVWVHDEGQAQRVFTHEACMYGDDLAAFLRWLTPPGQNQTDHTTDGSRS